LSSLVYTYGPQKRTTIHGSKTATVSSFSIYPIQINGGMNDGEGMIFTVASEQGPLRPHLLHPLRPHNSLEIYLIKKFKNIPIFMFI
jgi:hypothetical protein